MLLGITAEGTPRFIYLMFETISALATVGVTANLTPELGKLALSICHGAHVYWPYRSLDLAG